MIVRSTSICNLKRCNNANATNNGVEGDHNPAEKMFAQALPKPAAVDLARVSIESLNTSFTVRQESLVCVSG